MRRPRARRPWGAAAALCLVLGCAGAVRLDPPGVPVPPEAALALNERAAAFYQALASRRFNTLDTFNDPVLREHFQTVDLFFDYYADLAQALAGAHFEKSRPSAIEVQEFVFDGPQQARVLIRFDGQDRRPLRPDATSLHRIDRWVRVDGQWWVNPEKL